LQLQKDRSGPLPKDIGQSHPGEKVNRMPQPALVGLAPHETPHFIDLCRLYAPHLAWDCVGTASLDDAFVYGREGGRFFFIL